MSMGGSKSTAKQPTRLMGIDFSGAQYGACVTVAFGRNKFPGNVIWYGDFKATPHKEKQPGKGGGAKSSTTFTYSASFQIGLSEGISSVLNVYDGTTVKSLAAAGGVGFTGSLTQSVWAHLSGIYALNYSGTSHVAFQDLDLGSSASLPNLSFEVAGRNQFGGGIDDANPADIVTAICTDSQIGISFGALGDTTSFRTYCTAAGLFFSPVYNQQQPAMQALDDLFKYANTAAWFSEGVLKVKPYGDVTITGNGATYTPDLTPVADLGPNDLITNGPGAAVSIRRKSPADAQNLVRLEYKDRSANYRTIPVQASIDQDVVTYGARAQSNETVDMITTAATARLVAQHLLQRTFYIRNTYEFQLAWRWCFLEPMDVVTLTDANTGLLLTPVRITEISEDEHGLLSVTAEELPDGIGHGGSYATATLGGATVDPNVDPGAITAPYLFRAPGFLVSAGAPEVWCAVASTNDLWGGCDIYISQDGTSYNFLRTHFGEASYGNLTNSMAVQADLDTVSAPNVVLNGGAKLLGGLAADRDQFVTLAMIDTELVSYQTATLAAGPSYTLSSLRRGGYGTAIATHAASAPFVRLDESIIRIPIDPSQVGKTIYLKFVSFNVFGNGPRTLASEAAYTYVVGTNVEFPDVPAVPASFAAVPVADGVNLKWTNSNPAAVDCTSIEYATAVGGPYTVLAQVGPANTSYHHAFTAGSTFYYRLRARGETISGGWSGYTSILNSTGKTVADGADVTITKLAGRGVNLMPDPYSTYESTSVPAGIGTGGCSVGVARVAGIITSALRATSNGTLGYHYYEAGDAAAQFPHIVGRKYIVSCFIKPSHATITQVALYVRGSPSTTAAATAGTPTAFPAGVWTRVSAIVDVSALTDPNCTAFPLVYGMASGQYYDCDGIMVEELVGLNNTPSAYSRGDTSKLANSKTATFNSTTQPTFANVNDSWFNPSTGITKVWNGTAWVFQSDQSASATAISIANPKFEQGFEGWTPTGLWGIQAAAGFGGSTRALFTGSGAGLARLSNMQNFSVKPGATLVLTAQLARNVVAADASFWIGAFFYQPDGTWNGNADIPVALSEVPGGWCFVRKTTVVPAGTGYCTFQLMSGATAGGAWGVDNCTMAMAADYDSEVVDGSAYARGRSGNFNNGVVTGLSYGNNLVPNPTFTNNITGAPTSLTVSGPLIADNWVSSFNPGAFNVYREYVSGVANVMIRLLGTYTFPASSGYLAGTIANVAKIEVIAGRKYRFVSKIQLDRAAAPPAGISWILRTNLQWFKSDDSYISEAPSDFALALGAGTSDDVRTAPAGAAYAVVSLCAYWNNTNAYTVAVGGALWGDMRWYSVSLSLVSNLDQEVEDGVTYGKFSLEDRVLDGTRYRMGLRVAGSNHRIADQRNLPQIGVQNARAKVPTVITYSSAAGTPATATISVAAFTTLAGSISIAYSAMSVGVTGTNSTVVTFHLYFDDPNYVGGAQTLVATTVGNNIFGSDNRVFVGTVDVVFPGSGTGGGTAPPRDPCVTADMLMSEDALAGEVAPGYLADCLDLPTGDTKFQRRIIGIDYSDVECVRITTDDGAMLDCSVFTPFDLLDGRVGYAPDMLGEYVITDLGIETVVTVEPIGVRPVCHIHLGGISYAAGHDARHRIYSHNTYKP